MPLALPSQMRRLVNNETSDAAYIFPLASPSSFFACRSHSTLVDPGQRLSTNSGASKVHGQCHTAGLA